MKTLIVAIALGTPLVQDPAAPLAELATGIEVTIDDYKDYLFEVTGRARLGELVLDRILAAEAAHVDPSRVADDVRRGLADVEASVDGALTRRIEEDFGGDRAAFERQVRAIGRTLAEERAATRVHVVRALRTAALVQASRPADETRLRHLFDHHYGVGGERVRVRQLFLSFHKARRALAAAGAQPAGDAQVEAHVRARAAELHRALLRGEPFAEAILRASDDEAARALARDPTTRAEAGRLRGYNYQQFGVPFAEAVRALEPGAFSGPVRSSHGYHLILLDERRVTRFEDVQDELRALLREEPPTRAEERALRERLFAEYRVPETIPR